VFVPFLRVRGVEGWRAGHGGERVVGREYKMVPGRVIYRARTSLRNQCSPEKQPKYKVPFRVF
jgi:hypothetical protein